MPRDEVKAVRYIDPPPPEEMVRIARERTLDIVRLWAASIPWNPVSISILAESCYMQGVNDCVGALRQKELVIQPANVQDVWEGYCG